MNATRNGAAARRGTAPAGPLDSAVLRRIMHNPATMIRRAQQICTAIFFAECGGEDVTPLQYGALWTLTLGSGIDQTTLGRAMAVDRTTTATVVRKGWTSTAITAR